MTYEKSFNFVRWFLVLSLICVALVGIGTSILLSRFLSERILQRDAEVSREFLQSAAQFQNAIAYFREPGPTGTGLAEFVRQVGFMPDVIRANVYSLDRKLLWSTTPSLVGRHFDYNHELEEALQGDIAIETGTAGEEKEPKEEHMQLGMESAVEFVENYLPIFDPDTGKVVGVVEVYRYPQALFQTIYEGTRLIWIAMALGSLFLYVCLFWVVRRADHIIKNQHERLVESETLAALGEMAGAVAHGIRNPLSSIRTSAELMQGNIDHSPHDSAKDIVAEVDRLERWVRDLLVYSQPEQVAFETMPIQRVLDEALAIHRREIDRRGIRLAVDCAANLPLILADINLLTQAFNSLLSNAIEALSDDGDLSIVASVEPGGGAIRVTIQDNGSGIPADQIAQVFRAFYTTKKKGLGVGLPLVKRIIKRHRGSIDLRSVVGKGTCVDVILPTRS
ncbi:MAG: ATP-binding protein [Burkholderiales bacterium]